MQLLDTHPRRSSGAPTAVQSLAASPCCATSFASLDAYGTVRLYDTRLRQHNYMTVLTTSPGDGNNTTAHAHTGADASELVYFADRHLAVVLQGCAAHVVDVRRHMRVVASYTHDSELACVVRSSGGDGVVPPAGASQALLVDDDGRALVFDALTAAPTRHVEASVFGRDVVLPAARSADAIEDVCGGCCLVCVDETCQDKYDDNDDDDDDKTHAQRDACAAAAAAEQSLFVVDMSGNGIVYDAALRPRHHFCLDDDDDDDDDTCVQQHSGSRSDGKTRQHRAAAAASLVNPPVVTCCCASGNTVATGRGNGMYDVLTVDATRVRMQLSSPGHAVNGLCYVDWSTRSLLLLTVSLCGEVTLWDVGAYLAAGARDEDNGSGEDVDDAGELPAVRAAHHHRDAAALGSDATVNCVARLARGDASYVLGDTAGNITLLTLSHDEQTSSPSWSDASTAWRRMQYYMRARLLLDRSKLRAHEVVVAGAGSNRRRCALSNNKSSTAIAAAAAANNNNNNNNNDDDAYVVVDANAFVDAVLQRRLLYFSYRYDFAPLPNAATTDAGWGCLLRTGQMLLACALVRHHGGDDAVDDVAQREGSSGSSGSSNSAAARLTRVREHVRALFMDVPDAPLGIHALQHCLHASGVAYGTMLTPTQMAMALAAAYAHYSSSSSSSVAAHDTVMAAQSLVVLCCAGGDVDEVRVRGILQQEEQQQTQAGDVTSTKPSVLLLVPLNLGLGGLSDKYGEALRRMLAMRSACGVAGGSRATSVLYIGYQHDTLLYVDPHYMQRAYTSPTTYGRRSPLRAHLPIRESNTSMLLACYVRDAAAFDAFAADLQHVNAPLRFPVISLVTRTHTARSASDTSSRQVIELLSVSGDDAAATSA